MRIIKKKKDYFYLQHSVREGDKVKTKEKYLGKEIPRNIDEIKKKMEESFKIELYNKLKKIKKDFQDEWKKYPSSVKEKVKEEISIAFTYNTNAIEGSTITFGEAREIIHYKTAPNKSLYDIRETEMHSKVFLEMLDKKEKMSNSLLLRWHKEIFEETKIDIAGKFRDFRVRVGHYRAPDWQDVEKFMKEFIKFTINAKINSVELAAIAHYRFEKIHPFGDGNGRIGRLLMNHILWHNNYPMMIIEYKKRKSYYKALDKDEEGFVKYFLRRYLSVNKERWK